MNNVNCRGIVLRKIPSLERDQTAIVLTYEFGKVFMAGKNARSSRRFGSGLDIGVEARFEITRKRTAERLTAIGAETIHKAKIDDYDALTELQKFLNFVDQILPMGAEATGYYVVLAWLIQQPITLINVRKAIEEIAKVSGESTTSIHGIEVPVPWRSSP